MTTFISTETPTERLPSYRDAQLSKLIKELRAAVQPFPRSKAALIRVERRLKFLLRLLDAWDATYAERAETSLQLGNVPAANTAASMIFDTKTRTGLLKRAPIGIDYDAGDRVAENAELEREVLE